MDDVIMIPVLGREPVRAVWYYAQVNVAFEERLAVEDKLREMVAKAVEAGLNHPVREHGDCPDHDWHLFYRVPVVEDPIQADWRVSDARPDMTFATV